MIAQAEHIPVHLGAMPDAVAAVARTTRPGDVFDPQRPFAGGTHLPTSRSSRARALGFAVTRAHHADVGGTEPAACPPSSRRLDEEGVVIPPTRLDDARLDALVARCATRRAPRRPPRASSRRTGSPSAPRRALRAPRRERVDAAMDELYAYSERVVRAAIARSRRPLRGARRARAAAAASSRSSAR
jgi:N-methylhydantoinase B